MNGTLSSAGTVAAVILAGLTLLSSPAPGAKMTDGSQPTVIPPYHDHAPRGPLPATLDPAQFPDPVNQKSYGLAAQIKKVLYQQPCYCPCSREEGHKSLLDCFVDTHASICDVCKQEAIYAYEQSREGKTAKQIRKGIIKGEWEKVDLSRYR